MSQELEISESEMPKVIPVPIQSILIKRSIVSKSADASILVVVFSILCLAASAYLLISAVPPVYTLGTDVIRPSEIAQLHGN